MQVCREQVYSSSQYLLLLSLWVIVMFGYEEFPWDDTQVSPDTGVKKGGLAACWLVLMQWSPVLVWILMPKYKLSK